VCMQAGFYLAGRGLYEEVEPLLVRALSIQEKAFGPEHPETALSLGGLAVLYQAQGRFSEAEPLAIRTRAIRAAYRGSR